MVTNHKQEREESTVLLRPFPENTVLYYLGVNNEMLLLQLYTCKNEAEVYQLSQKVWMLEGDLAY